ncbi:MAG TPA: rhodanese-like domain-containing protein [Longimicrobiaceae bacterium]|nr:rhodanese-like domain-containing protein [Longimicrobiaceae bacterium]
MIVKRFYDEKLAQASYLIGCAMHEEAVVIDANRDIEQYIRMAEQEGVRITHVTETHIHADYVSGSRELAYRTGAQLYLSDEGDENWKYAFAREAGAILLRDGDDFAVGNVKIQALHTPGHTPEHLSFLVTDGAAADRPIGIVTGDFVFVGDVGRPDLLERAAGVEGTMVAGARTLFHSLERFKDLPDYLQIWPGHGAGSACGKGLSSIPTSTVGYERLFNWGLSMEDEEAFVAAVLDGQPEPPRYFAEMKRINKEGPRLLGGFRRPQRLPESRIGQLLNAGHVVVDTRQMADYAASHIPGTINIPLNRSFNTWAGWLLPYDADVYLIVNDSCTHCVDEATRDLAMIGLDRIGGYFGTEVVESWVAHGGDSESIPQITPEELHERLDDSLVIDVRGHSEWETGHLPGVEIIPVGYILDELDRIPRDTPVVVYCQGGGRSAIAASLLESRGYGNVSNLGGGYDAWRRAGLPVERPVTNSVGSGA